MYFIIIFSFVIVTITIVIYNFCYIKMKRIQFFLEIQKVEKIFITFCVLLKSN